MIPPRLRQILILTSVVLVVLILAGATYQGVATALERRRYPHPGQLHDVGGHQLHIYCSGDGAPAVILEAGSAGLSASWGLVQPEIAEETQVCSYDRAGLGWSEAGDGPFDPARVPDELHALLAAARVKPPYVVAGHELGASFARLFAGRYPREVAALVLVDPAGAPAPDSGVVAVWPWLARTGVLRATGILSGAADGLPPAAEGALSSFLNRPDHLTRAGREIARWPDIVRLGDRARLSVPAMTVHTVKAGDLDDGYVIERAGGVLNEEGAARRVSAAIGRAVTRARTP